MKQKKKSIFPLFLLFILSILILGFTIKYSLNNENEEKKIDIEINKDNKIVDIIDVMLNPADIIKYQLVTNMKEEVEIEVSIYFENVDKEIGRILTTYAEYDGVTTEKKLVYDVTNLNKIKFTAKSNSIMYLYFELSSEIGNEFQNKKYEFDTYISMRGK